MKTTLRNILKKHMMNYPLITAAELQKIMAELPILCGMQSS
jgi:hypothetical protein